jgi:hypothetical protein
MKHFFYTFTFVIMSVLAYGQDIITFEDANLEVNEYRNGGDLPIDDNYFYFNDVRFQSNYDTMFQYWTSGWAVSTVKDSTTNSFSNLYGAYPFAGADESLTFMVGQYTSTIEIPDTLGAIINSIDITNASFPLLVMRDGDPSGFSKKFGGDDGNDPDYFLLDIKGIDVNGDSIGNVSFYLADYRFEDNSQDYIIKEWKTVDLTELGTVKSLEFSLSSSDANQFGILTPALYCVDNFKYAYTTNVENPTITNVNIGPNPTLGNLFIDMHDNKGSQISLFNLNGQLIKSWYSVESRTTLDLSALKKGSYLIHIQSDENVYTEKVFVH